MSDDETSTPATIEASAPAVPAPPPAAAPPPPAPPAPAAAAGPPRPAPATAPGPPRAAPARHVYAIGRIEPRFPGLGIEKEFAQATGRAATSGLTDREVVHAILADPANRYLARQLCWVFTIEGQDTYVLVARDATDLDMLIEAIRPAPTNEDIDVVIGSLGPLASPDHCNGLVVPMVAFTQIYSFDTASFLAAIPKPDGMAAKAFKTAAAELFGRIQQLADNAGASDEHRALNYLAVRYPAIYAHATERFAKNATLSSVEVQPSRLSGIRSLVNVIFTFTDRTTGVPDKAAVRVDVSEEFPFLVSALSPYYDR
jgi:hypothetical protein